MPSEPEEPQGPSTLVHCEVEIRSVLEPSQRNVAIGYLVRLLMWRDDTDATDELAAATLWRVRIDDPSWLRVVDEIGGDVYTALESLSSTHGDHLDEVFADDGDLVYLEPAERALDELMSTDLSSLDVVVLMIDGAPFAGHLCVVALGIGVDGTKHPLSLVEGSTENATVVKALLTDLRDRGLDVTRPTLVVIDGAKALASAVREVFDRPQIQRCQLRKVRNVANHLPDALGATVATKMRAAYRDTNPLTAQATLEQLAKSIAKTHPGAAGSLREGLAETLTIGRLGVPPTLARTLRSTNAIESMIEICRDHSTNVKRWRDGQMALRWCGSGMAEAAKQFRRVNGHLYLPALRAALDRHAATDAAPTSDTDHEAA